MMSNSKFFDAKESNGANMYLDVPTNGVHFPGNYSNKIGDHCDAQNHGLVNNQIFNPHQLNQSPESVGADVYLLNSPTDGVPFPAMNNQPGTLISPEIGANAFPLARLPNHVPFQLMSTQISQNQSAPPEACPQQFETAANYPILSRGMGNFQHPHRWNQPEGAFNMENPSISPQMNPCPFAKPGSSQSSNISYADHQKRLKKQECDRKSRAKKEKTRKDNEERLVKVTEENNQLRNDNGRLKEGEVAMKKELKNFEEKISHLEKQVSYLNNKLRGQNTKMDALSDKLVACSESADLVGENKQLKRKIELLSTPLNNPDSWKILELYDEMENWKRKAKKRKVVIEALCDKMNNDDHERERSTPA